jgi:hypothetical protein
MSLVIPNGSLTFVLDQLIDGEFGTLQVMHLFQNNVTVSDTTVIGDLEEATFDGYNSQGISGWSDALAVLPRAMTGANALTWAKIIGANPNSIYGYYVTDLDGNLLWCENDPSAPVAMTTPGNTYTVVPRFTIRSEF